MDYHREQPISRGKSAFNPARQMIQSQFSPETLCARVAISQHIIRGVLAVLPDAGSTHWRPRCNARCESPSLTVFPGTQVSGIANYRAIERTSVGVIKRLGLIGKFPLLERVPRFLLHRVKIYPPRVLRLEILEVRPPE